MTLTRTTQRWVRAYVDGYDMSGYSRNVGPLVWEFDEAEGTTLADAVKGYLPHLCTMTPSVINANFDTNTLAPHNILVLPGTSRGVMIAFGMNAEPTIGNAVYCGKFQQKAYQMTEDGGFATATLPFEGWSASDIAGYEIPWGRMQHLIGTSETAVNTSTGYDWGAGSTKGGYIMWQVAGGDGTATIKLQHSTTTNVNGSFSDVTGLTSGVIDCSTRSSGIAVASKTLTVGQYTRWQIVLGTASTVTFALAFVRGIH